MNNKYFIPFLVFLGLWMILAFEMIDAKNITKEQALCLIQELHTQEYCLNLGKI